MRMKSKIVNNILILIGLCLIFSQTAKADYSYCWVYNESDDASTYWSLRWDLAELFHGYSDSHCAPPEVSPGDQDYFDQLIIFATKEVGVSDSDAVKSITLGSSGRWNDPLEFYHHTDTLVIGNWSDESVNDSNSDMTYSSDYKSLFNMNYGTMIIDGQTYFDEGTSPLSCASWSENVYFRNIVLLTNGVAKEDLGFCIHDAGAFYVCPGEYNERITPGDSGWCLWDEQEEETNDQDGDGYVATSAGGDDCDDSSRRVHPGASEIPGDGIDQDCDGVDGACTLSVTPATASVTAGESYEFTVVYRVKGGYTKNAKLIVTGLDKTMSQEEDQELEAGETIAANITTTSETPAGTYSLIFSGRKPVRLINNQAGFPNVFSFPYPLASTDQNMNSDDQNQIFYACEDTVDLTVEAPEIEEPAAEVCDDGLDNDEDSLVDCDDSDCTTDESCQDDVTTTLILEDNCTNGMDDDKDGLVDCDDSDCASTAVCQDPGVDDLDEDLDGDGYYADTDLDGDCHDGLACDCDDDDASIYPTATEVCDDGVDNDCDGVAVNEDDIDLTGLSCQVAADPPVVGGEESGGCSLVSVTMQTRYHFDLMLFCLSILCMGFFGVRWYVRRT
jgi:hypothetical protein